MSTDKPGAGATIPGPPALIADAAFPARPIQSPQTFSFGPVQFQHTDGIVLIIAAAWNAPGFAPDTTQLFASVGSGGAIGFARGPSFLASQGNWTLWLQEMWITGEDVSPSMVQVQWSTMQPSTATSVTAIFAVFKISLPTFVSAGAAVNTMTGFDNSPQNVSNNTIAPGTGYQQLMYVAGVSANPQLGLSGGGWDFDTGLSAPIRVPSQHILDFIRTQKGTYLVAVDQAPSIGASAIGRSTDGGKNWMFNALPNNALPTAGLTECADGTVLVPNDGSAGSGFVFRSADDGQHFLPVQPFPTSALYPAVTPPANVYLKYFPLIDLAFAYVSQQGGALTAVYKSMDRGQSWGTQPVFSSTTSAPLSQQSTSWMAVTRGETHWGVDSLEHVTTPVGNYPNLFSAVAGETGRTPEFWGRYIGPRSGNLMPDEVTLLHGEKCRILLIYRDTTIPPFAVSTYQQGVDHASNAINDATARGIPGGVWIYADITHRCLRPLIFSGGGLIQ